MKRESYSRRVWRSFWIQSPMRMGNRAGLVLIGLLVLASLAAPFLANDLPLLARCKGHLRAPIAEAALISIHLLKGPLEQPEAFSDCTFRVMPPLAHSPNSYNLSEVLLPPQSGHVLGTDEQGRDVLSRMIHGARISLSVGLVAVSLYVAIGVLLGAIAGYFGGRFDLFLSRAIEIMICFPTFFLILAILAFVGPSIYNIMVVIGLTGWTGVARLVRGEFLKLRQMDYVSAGRALGLSSFRLMLRHLLPNAMGPVLVSASFGVASTILVESSLSFLGFGVQPPTPSWGSMLSQARDFLDFAWWLTLFPGLAIFIAITSYNLVGEGLRDAMDPKTAR